LASDRAHIAHLTIADAVRQLGERGNTAAHILRLRHVGVTRGRADDDATAFAFDAVQLGDPAHIHQIAGRREAQLHRAD
jgi:hypothetical protein